MVNGSLLIFLCLPCDLFLYVVYLGPWASYSSLGFHSFSLFVTLASYGAPRLSTCLAALSPPCNRLNASEPSAPFSPSVCVLILILIHVAHCLYYMLAPNHSNHRSVHCQARGQSRRDVAANDVGPFKRSCTRSLVIGCCIQRFTHIEFLKEHAEYQ
jgi:hypothetical protein